MIRGRVKPQMTQMDADAFDRSGSVVTIDHPFRTTDREEILASLIGVRQRKIDRAAIFGRAFSVLTFLLIVGGAFSQTQTQAPTQVPNSATIKLFVQPYYEVQYIYNDTVRLKEASVHVVRLPVGDHRFLFWAPNCSILDTTLHVEFGEDMELHKMLKHTPEFLAYKHDRSRIGMQKALWRGVPLLFTVGFGIVALSDHKAHDRAYDDLHALQDSYSTMNVPSSIKALKESAIPAAQDELDATRRQLIISTTLCGVCALATAYGFIRAGKLKYPVYEDKEKVRFEGLAWAPTGNGGTYLAQIEICL